MKIPHEKFCVLPWVSIEASPVGTLRPCCLAEDEIVDDAGNKFNLASANFTDIQHSQHMQQLRQEFINGQQPKTCGKCWNEESAGRTSKRMHTLDRLKHMVNNDPWTQDAKPLLFLDLKLGNICNLKCRICGSWSSSTFAVEEIAHDPSPDRKNSFHYQMLKQGRWPRENTVFWEQIANSIDQLRYIEFTGGEPFMIQEHFDMLQRLVDLDVAHRIEIHYNTNGTQYPEHAIDIWRHFKTVEIAFSIDDIGDRFEYQRSGAVWSDVLVNLKLFKQLREQHKNIQLQICCTVNVFNVYYLETVADWIAVQGFDFVYWNMLHEARHFCIDTLSKHAKTIISDQLMNARVDHATQIQFTQIVDFMNNNNSTDGQLLKQQIDLVDRRRNENFVTTFPELAQALQYE